MHILLQGSSAQTKLYMKSVAGFNLKKSSVCDLTLSVNVEWGVVEIILLITLVKPFESSLKINFYWNPFACGSNVFELVCFSKLRVTNVQTTYLNGGFCSAKLKKLQRKFYVLNAQNIKQFCYFRKLQEY